MAFGVDLGTTNSSIAWADRAGTVHSLKVRRGPKEPFDAVERSAVLDPLGEAGDPVVGHRAVEEAKLRPGERVLLTSFKPKLDKQRLRQNRYEVEHVATSEYDPVEQMIRYDRRRAAVPVYYDEHSRDEVVSAASLMLHRMLTSQEIDPNSGEPSQPPARSALSRLFRRGRTSADREAKGGVPTFKPAGGDRLYVGVPVTFGPTARKRLLASLVRSGCFGEPGEPDTYRQVMDRCRFVYEPLAVASTLQVFESQRVLVFDYGGGSLDIALLEFTFDDRGRAVRELALGGLTRAGDWLDEVFRERILEDSPSLRNAYEQQLKDGSAYDRWLANSSFTLAKVELSSHDATTMTLFNHDVTRADFEAAIRLQLDEAIDAVADTLRRAALRPRDVGQVVLTGGSSLLPALQERLRDFFSHLDDLTFVAGRSGDVDSERESLTGVSRGLARFGFLEGFEASAACDYVVSVPGTQSPAPCLRRGGADVRELADSPAVPVPVGARRPTSFVLYSTLVRETFCGALADIDIPPSASEVEIRMSASRERFLPAFSVHLPGQHEPLALFDLEALPPRALQSFIESDEEWLPQTNRLFSAFLTRPLELGDFAEWQTNGRFVQGKIIRIRHVDKNVHVDAMDGFDPLEYRVTVALEDDGRVVMGRQFQCDWRTGDVRLL